MLGDQDDILFVCEEVGQILVSWRPALVGFSIFKNSAKKFVELLYFLHILFGKTSGDDIHNLSIVPRSLEDVYFAIILVMSRADERHDITVEEYITSINDKATRKDAQVLADLMHRISGKEPILYGIGTIGYDVFSYEYASGRKGESHTLAFYPRKGKITVYLSDGTARYAKLLTKLGKHTITGYCVYIKQLSDIELPVLKQILEESYKNITTKSKDGPITQILWQAEI